MLILVRHGEATANAAGLLLGRSDPPLTPRGEQQAMAVGGWVGSAGRCVSSPLRRALDTARLLGLGVPVEVDRRWVERDYGAEEGAPASSLGLPDGERSSRWADPSFSPNGGESLSDVGRRVADAMAELFADDGRGARAPGDDVVVVSHVSPIKAAVAWVLGVDDQVVWRMHLSTGSLTRIGWASGAPVLLGFNWTP